MGNLNIAQQDLTKEQLQLISAPFAKWTPEKINAEIKTFVNEAGLQDDESFIYRGAKLAQDKNAFERSHDRLSYRNDLNEELWLDQESKGKGKEKFRQTWTLYALVIVCSIGATVQGWDESAVSSGAFCSSRL